MLRKLLIALTTACIALSYSTSASAQQPTDSHLCLTQAIYFESRGEPLRGQIAVAHVVMNRVSSGKFPRTVCGVVYQRGQFSWVRDNRPNISNGYYWQRASKIAREVLDRQHADESQGAHYFYSHHINPPKWARRGMTVKIGSHVFIR